MIKEKQSVLRNNLNEYDSLEHIAVLLINKHLNQSDLGLLPSTSTNPLKEWLGKIKINEALFGLELFNMGRRCNTIITGGSHRFLSCQFF